MGVQEETPEAVSASRSYLTIGVLGGLVTLMGVFLLYHLAGTLQLDALRDACAAVENRRLLYAGRWLYPVWLCSEGGHVPAAFLDAPILHGGPCTCYGDFVRRIEQGGYFRRFDAYPVTCFTGMPIGVC